MNESEYRHLLPQILRKQKKLNHFHVSLETFAFFPSICEIIALGLCDKYDTKQKLNLTMSFMDNTQQQFYVSHLLTNIGVIIKEVRKCNIDATIKVICIMGWEYKDHWWDKQKHLAEYMHNNKIKINDMHPTTIEFKNNINGCLLYTSDAADD